MIRMCASKNDKEEKEKQMYVCLCYIYDQTQCVSKMWKKKEITESNVGGYLISFLCKHVVESITFSLATVYYACVENE